MGNAIVLEVISLKVGAFLVTLVVHCDLHSDFLGISLGKKLLKVYFN